MELNKYNNFLLKSSITEIILESKLELLANLRNVLYELTFSDDKSVSKVANTLLDIAKSEKDLRLVQNFVNVDSDATKVSFVPDNRVNYDEESDIISLKFENGELSHIVAPGHEIIKGVGIPLVGLKQTCLIDELPSNRWRLLGTYEGKKAGSNYSEYTLYHLQNVDEPNVYIVTYSSNRHGFGFTKTPSIPENLRGSIKIGRFVNRIFDLYFANNKDERSNYTASDVEKFVNAYSAIILFRINASQYFEIVSGEKIKYWYYKDNYVSQIGQLGSSCMRHESCQEYFNIYIENSDVCQLLIFKNITGDKINGRALLWTDIYGKKWIDRVYTIKDSYSVLFKKWAEENGYENIYKSDKKTKIKVKNKDYIKYPYLDSFIYFKSGFLTNKKPNKPYCVLQDTFGSYDLFL